MTELDEFRQARCGSVGASDAPDLMRRTKTGYSATRANLMALKVLERLTGVAVETYQSKAMADGIEKQPQAIATYELMFDLNVEYPPAPGLVPHPLIEGAHASPDGLIGAFGLVEVKCPQMAAHLDTLLTEQIEKDYRIQIQWQLACTGRHWCDYVSWNPEFPPAMQLFVQRVGRDPDLMEDIEDEVRKFLFELEIKVNDLRRKYEVQEEAA
jgi:predicted phage-related endonuclease